MFIHLIVQISGSSQERLEHLQKMIRPFILRRLKKEVLKDLPDKIEKNMMARMEQERKELYQAHAQRLALTLQNQTEEEFADSRFQVLSELTRLRQLCCDPALVYDNYEGWFSETRSLHRADPERCGSRSQDSAVFPVYLDD